MKALLSVVVSEHKTPQILYTTLSNLQWSGELKDDWWKIKKDLRGGGGNCITLIKERKK